MEIKKGKTKEKPRIRKNPISDILDLNPEDSGFVLNPGKNNVIFASPISDYDDNNLQLKWNQRQE